MISEVTDALAALVGFPTVSRTPNGDLQDWLAGRLAALGARVEVVEGAHPGRSNLVATLGPEAPGGLLLSGHTDVVDPGGGWSSDPWVLTETDGRLHGRGTADMKGFLACALVALSRIDPGTLRAPVRLVASYDEEIGCVGVRDVLGDLSAASAPALVVIGEPTMMRPRHSHLGKRAYSLVTRAQPGHSSRAAVMPSAITAAAHLVGVIAAIQDACPPGTGPDTPAVSLNCGTITGGTATNVIAERCEVTFEVRHDTAHDPDAVLAPLLRAVAGTDARLATAGGGAECTLVTEYPAMRTDPTLSAFAAAVRIADAGPSVDLGYGTEGGLIASATGAPVMICGPGDIADAHRPDEHVERAQLGRCVAFLAALVEETCTREGS